MLSPFILFTALVPVLKRVRRGLAAWRTARRIVLLLALPVTSKQFMITVGFNR
jgi:hypothetical protein